MNRSTAVLCASLIAASSLLGCAAPPDSSRTESALAAPNAVTTWHAHAQALVAGFAGHAFAAQAYTQSLIQVAVYDAVVAIEGSYPPFVADIDAPAGANLDAAIATAAYRVGITRVNAGASGPAFQTAYTNFMAAIPESQSKTDGIAVGESAAQAVLAARANDNFYNAAVYSNVVDPDDPLGPIGVWQAQELANQYAPAGAADYDMSFVVPLTASSPSTRRAPPPPNMRSARYAYAVNEVKTYGSLVSASRTPAMTDVVQFWTESGFTLWQRNSRQIVIDAGLDELESARALAAIGVAGGDGMLACFENKYHYLNWRPFQAIQRADGDGNARTRPVPGWAPLVRANHPEYPAGHACYGSAMTTALKMVFGREFPLTLTSTGSLVANWPVQPLRVYPSFGDVIDETANARIWGGLHYRTTMVQSARFIKDVTNDALCGRFGIVCGG